MAKNDKIVFKLEDKIESSASKIEVIKNLIFGETIQEYDAELEVLKKEVLKKKQELENLIDEVKSDLNTTLDSVATDVNIRITELEKNFSEKIEDLQQDQVNKDTLGKLLIEMGERIGGK